MNITRQLTLLLIISLCISCTDKEKLKAEHYQKKQQKNLKLDFILDTINTEHFWALIDKSVFASNGDDTQKEEILIEELSKLSAEEVKNFEVALRKNIIDADEYNLMAALKVIEGYVSDDSYLYFRCWLIGQGHAVYQSVLDNPDYLAKIVNPGDMLDFEPLLYVSTEAYAILTGKDEDDTFPRDYALGLGLDYDFDAPPTKGTEWMEDELPNTFPNLWAKLN